MDQDEEWILELDEEFKADLISIKPFIERLASVEDARLCKLWLDKLHNSLGEQELRNVLLKNLIENVKCGVLCRPFNEPPSSINLSSIKVIKENEASRKCASESRGNPQLELNEILCLKEENEYLKKQNAAIQEDWEQMNKEVISLRYINKELKEENSKYKNNCTDKETKTALTDCLVAFTNKLNEVCLHKADLASVLRSIESKMNIMIHHFNNQESDKQLKTKIEETKQKLNTERRMYQKEIEKLQDIIAGKNQHEWSREKSRISSMHKEKKNHLSQEGQLNLKLKIICLKQDIAKLEMANKELVEEYENRLQKSKVQINNEDNSKWIDIQKITNELEERYKMILLKLQEKATAQRQHDAMTIQQLYEKVKELEKSKLNDSKKKNDETNNYILTDKNK